MNIRNPSGQTDHVRLDQANHHPGQRLEVPDIQPIPMLTQYLYQCIIESVAE